MCLRATVIQAIPHPCPLVCFGYTWNNIYVIAGLFDFSAGPEFVGREIVKCIDLAKDGIHAVLVVFSVRTRFSQEEEAALCGLQTLFGSKIVDYMIVVFTGGDELEDNDETLDDYLGRGCPEPLKVSCKSSCKSTLLLELHVHCFYCDNIGNYRIACLWSFYSQVLRLLILKII